VSLKVADGSIRLTISDNGKGMESGDREKAGGGFGLSGLEQRTRMLHGSLSITPGTSGGTRLRLEIPAGKSEP
jgi:signal transduction histidine kinase